MRTGINPRTRNAGRKHTASGAAMNTPARSARAVACAEASARSCATKRWHPVAMAAPDSPDNCVKRTSSSKCGWLASADHAVFMGTPTPMRAAASDHCGEASATASTALRVERPASRQAAKSSKSLAASSGPYSAAGPSRGVFGRGVREPDWAIRPDGAEAVTASAAAINAAEIYVKTITAPPSAE